MLPTDPSGRRPAVRRKPLNHAFQVTDLRGHGLPQGWTYHDGHFHLDKRPRDYWEVKAGCLIRHHLVTETQTVLARSAKGQSLQPHPARPGQSHRDV